MEINLLTYEEKRINKEEHAQEKREITNRILLTRWQGMRPRTQVEGRILSTQRGAIEIGTSLDTYKCLCGCEWKRCRSETGRDSKEFEVMK